MLLAALLPGGPALIFGGQGRHDGLELVKPPDNIGIVEHGGKRGPEAVAGALSNIFDASDGGGANFEGVADGTVGPMPLE